MIVAMSIAGMLAVGALSYLLGYSRGFRRAEDLVGKAAAEAIADIVQQMGFSVVSTPRN